MHDLENLCIRVPKVYDWVNRQVDLPLMSFIGNRGLAKLNFDCEGASGSKDDPCKVLGKHTVARCFLSDSEGNPIDSLTSPAVDIEEIAQPDGRLSVTSTLPNGERVTLQKVKVLVKGFIVIEVSDAHGDTCISDPQPFAVAQTFFLCAPPGTEVVGHITFFECDSHLICDNYEFQQLDVSLTFCLDVQMEATVKVEVEGRFCRPRQELPINICDVRQIPPQCPDVFPGEDDDF
ncbi:hypothetical protein ACFOU2_13340 [Bacillus songklensis]|uniref:SipL SPOCS domain-containing protein n=1 Tax=Bacillus songklensis TaxID=1069116 RepID=A0ABV8B4Y4_9BACI